MITAAERSHRDIAESVHGTLCQTLGGAGIMAQVLAAGVKAGQPWDALQLDSLAETLDRALDEARQVLTQLQPVAAGPDGLMTALARLAAETSAGQTFAHLIIEDRVLPSGLILAMDFRLRISPVLTRVVNGMKVYSLHSRAVCQDQ